MHFTRLVSKALHQFGHLRTTAPKAPPDSAITYYLKGKKIFHKKRNTSDNTSPLSNNDQCRHHKTGPALTLQKNRHPFANL
ncbi:hypothetical protein FY152_09970 [Agrobacterium tumefaciens]|nr:hypothetical protein FY152_09970 [Agrobacterium tumefaciens]